ncbi:MAG: AAA family ATPase [Nitrososphaerota archaeon]|nr:AAA family ATPase [Nitrososphaerota archaeon]MDG7051005.1 AAA family ATPase [Nitrososphaerota archaeon]
MVSDDSLEKIFDRAARGSSIIKNENILRINYIPEKILYRDDQIIQLGQILSQVLRNTKPSNIFLYGKTGTGKTVVAKFIMKKLTEKLNNEKTKLIYLNTRLAGTEYRLLVELATSLGLTIPFTGLSISEALSRILLHIKQYKYNLVLFIDEVDFLVKTYGDDLLYQLTRTGDVLDKTLFLSLVGISNDLKFKDFLDPRVLSSLNEEEIIFPPYTVEEIKNILTERAKLAFTSGAVEESAINYCAALAGSEHGDARRAVDLLRVAAELTERDGEERITPTQIKKALKSIEKDRITEAIISLPIHSKAILLTISKFNETETTGKIYLKYLNICKSIGLQELTQRRVSSIISELDVLGLVTAPVINQGRFGRSKKIGLAIQKEEVIKALEQDETLSHLINL